MQEHPPIRAVSFSVMIPFVSMSFGVLFLCIAAVAVCGNVYGRVAKVRTFSLWPMFSADYFTFFIPQFHAALWLRCDVCGYVAGILCHSAVCVVMCSSQTLRFTGLSRAECKQGFFVPQTSLVCTPFKSCSFCKEALF